MTITRTDILVLGAGLVVGALAFAGCGPGNCGDGPDRAVSLQSGTFQSTYHGGRAGVEHPWDDSQVLKTMVVDLDAKTVTVRYLNADDEAVEEVWAVGDVEPYETYL